MQYVIIIIDLVLITTFYFLLSYIRSTSISKFRGNRICILIAHPDDETMFFMPIFKNLLNNNNNLIFLLCMSNGNADGLGNIRELELQRLVSFIGLNRSNILCINSSDLPDSMLIDWNINIIQKYLDSFVRNNNINCIITFDSYGISGHKNHIALNKAIKSFKTSNSNISYYELITTNIIRKYMGLLDCIYSVLEYIVFGNIYVFFHFSPYFVHECMKCHFSQYVWYRKLFIIFSRYTTINTIKQIY